MGVFLPDEQKYINKLTEIVEDNLTNSDFGVAELAREMGISHSTLHRRIKAIARQTISQFIRETRLKRGMGLLQLQAGTVAEIAYGVGFSSTTYFSKCFHDYYGYPPGEVKKRFVSKTGSQRQESSKVTAPHEIRSIAVLPFDNHTGDSRQDYLVQGMYDALINELGHLQSIRVVSKTSVILVFGSGKSLREMAKDLDVDAFIEGSVLLVDDNIRIQIRLIKVFPEDRLLWTQIFTVNISEVLKLYGQVLWKIANEIHLTLTPVQKTRIAERRKVNPESYKAYLRGKYFLYELTEEGMKKGLEYLHEAVLIDPAEPFAHAGLSLGFLEIAHGPLNPGDAFIKAESAALQALKLDQDLAEAQLALAELGMYANWKYNEAEQYFRKALELNPYMSLAHYHFAWLLFLLGRNEEALVEHELAQLYDPFNPLIVGHFGILYAYLDRHEDALRQIQKSFELQKNCPDGYFALVESCLAQEQEEKAIDASREFVTAHPVWNWVLGYAYASAGLHHEAERVIKEIKSEGINNWNAFGIAVILGHLGKMDEAYEWAAYEPHHAWVPWLTVAKMGRPFQEDKRFNEFKSRVKLSTL